MFIGPIAVSWCTTTSGRAARTAAITSSRSSASATTGTAPSSRSAAAFAGVRVIPCTSWPASASRRTSGWPTAPLAPAMKIRMIGLLGFDCNP